MKKTEIVGLSDEKLNVRIADERLALTKLRFAHAIQKIENPMRIRQTRKLIAKLNTELSKRKVQSASESK